MAIYLVGLNAKTHTVEERERYALLTDQIVNRNKRLKEETLIDEIVTLSTCNRVEHYFVTNHPLEDVIPQLFNNNYPSNIYIKSNFVASHHLFQVSSGLDSQIIGENEILGQVKNSYLLAQKNGLTGKSLNVLFQKAINIGKRARSATNISKFSISTGGIIIDKVKNHFKNMSKLKVLLIGAGDIAKNVAMSLHKKGIQNLLISNRSSEKGRHLAQEMEASYVPINQLFETIKEADVVISSTTAPHYIIAKEHEEYFIDSQKIMVDLAVPRDIEPDVAEYSNIEYYNIDNISNISDENKSKRVDEVNKANELIAMENCKFCLSLCLNVCQYHSSNRLYDFNQLYKTHKKSTY